MTVATEDIPVPAILWRGLGEVPANLGRCVVTLGVFDGLHRGHARLIDRAVRLARARGLPIVLVTFDPHPARVLGVPRDTSMLTSLDRRAELAGERGVDAVLALHFTHELAALAPKAFARDILAGRLHADGVVVDSNFTFGERGAGTLTTLQELGASHGFSAEGVGLLHAGDIPCSSTHIRSCLSAGDIFGATRALGRPHRVEGLRGGEEIIVAPGTAMPRPGSYRARIEVADVPGCHEAPIDVIDDRRLRVQGDESGRQRHIDEAVAVTFLS